MQRTPAIHYLRENHAERSPRRVVLLDTETRWRDVGTTEVHQLRLWVTRTLYRGGEPMHTLRSALASGSTADQLTDQIERIADAECSTWLMAHNLGFDLVTTRLPLLLIARGWVLGQHALTLDAPWLRLSKGRRRITMTDTFSYLPTSVEQLGLQLGVDKLTLPLNDDDDTAWLARCSVDVDILACAIEQLLDWWDRSKLGCWSLTGASTGWNAYKHHRHQAQVTIDPDPVARAWERRAINAGRREVWRVGHLPKARYVELDIERAHLTVCQSQLLPRKRLRAFDSMPIDDARLSGNLYAPIAECVVRTSEPRYPVEVGGRMWYPVGEFATILCGPELREAQLRGELVSVGHGYMYRLGATMTQWARWCADVLDGQVADAPPMALLACKAWSRRVPGKWATRTSTLMREIETPEQAWRLTRGIDHPSGYRCAQLHIGGRLQLLLQDQDADDAFPAVLAWIQSHTRVAISRLIDWFTDDQLVSCNTDGLIVRARRGPDIDALRAVTAPLRVRVKAVYSDVQVLSPQHLVLDGDPRLSGVPHSASSDAALMYAWSTWPSFTRQLELGSTTGYAREARRVDLTHVPVNRWVLADGSTVPPRAAVAGPGASELVDWASTPHPARSATLQAAQHPQLLRAARAVDAA